MKNNGGVLNSEDEHNDGDPLKPNMLYSGHLQNIRTILTATIVKKVILSGIHHRHELCPEIG